MPHGTFNPDGTVTITYNPFHGDKLYTDNGRKHLLPCERCGNVVPVSLSTCSVICEDCAPAIPSDNDWPTCRGCGSNLGDEDTLDQPDEETGVCAACKAKGVH